MSPIRYLCIKNHKNVGDRASTPFHYFGRPGVDEWKDIRDPIEPPMQDVTIQTVIIGGGGLLYPGLEDSVRKYVEHPGFRTVIWGIGANHHQASRREDDPPPGWLAGAHVTGLRDLSQNKYRHVPCASCLNPDFPRLRESNPVHKFVIYEHYDRPIPVPEQKYPVARNDLPTHTEALEFLASGRVVVTNTFHGAYWARLLGRKVLCYEPFSSRFWAPFGEDPLQKITRRDLSSLEQVSLNTKTHFTYLDNCVALNRAFWGRVSRP